MAAASVRRSPITITSSWRNSSSLSESSALTSRLDSSRCASARGVGGGNVGNGDISVDHTSAVSTSTVSGDISSRIGSPSFTPPSGTDFGSESASGSGSDGISGLASRFSPARAAGAAAGRRSRTPSGSEPLKALPPRLYPSLAIRSSQFWLGGVDPERLCLHAVLSLRRATCREGVIAADSEALGHSEKYMQEYAASTGSTRGRPREPRPPTSS